MSTDALVAARKALYLENKSEEALQTLLPLLEDRSSLSAGEERLIIELVGLAHQRQARYDEASQYFISTGDYYQAGYCQMLKGDMNKTLEFWRPLTSIRANHWCITLYGLITNRLNSLPTFLQIRNHLEADIMHLNWAGQQIFADNILRNIGILANTNFEAYKFVGRALFHVGQMEKAILFLLQGQKVLPNDPEIYYHLGQYYHAVGKLGDTALALHQCLLIAPSYTPAKDLLNSLEVDLSRLAP